MKFNFKKFIKVIQLNWFKLFFFWIVCTNGSYDCDTVGNHDKSPKTLWWFILEFCILYNQKTANNKLIATEIERLG